MSLRIGIVGLPNVGKSTLFKALTKKQVNIANYPFCTIEPNVGIVEVPDKRLAALAAVSSSEKIIAATVEFVDIAGLVAGAHKGEGLGNKFLSHIREVDAIAHVMRAFSDDDIIHVSGKINPNADLETIHLELIMADLATVEKRREAVAGKARTGDKDGQAHLALLDRLQTALAKGKRAATVTATEDERPWMVELNLLTAKPELFVLNVDETSIAQGLGLPHSDPHKSPLPDVIAISAKIEAELADLSPEDAQSYLTTLGLTESGLDRLIRQSYTLLHRITYFTAGSMETRAWTITKGMQAPQAAGVIHTDFEKGFIRAEVMDWKDLVELGSEAAVREKGKFRIEGKEYVMRDGDVCHFRVGT